MLWFIFEIRDVYDIGIISIHQMLRFKYSIVVYCLNCQSFFDGLGKDA